MPVMNEKLNEVAIKDMLIGIEIAGKIYEERLMLAAVADDQAVNAGPAIGRKDIARIVPLT